MSDSRVYLKVKLKSLAAESRIIRHEEHKRPPELRYGLRSHRIGVVRTEARATHLAYGFLRGHVYLRIEPKCYEAPDWRKARRMVEQYGDHTKDQLDAFDAWCKITATPTPELVAA